MPTDNKWIDKELLDDAFKAIDIFNEEGWEKGFDFLDVAKEKKERRKEIDESSGQYKLIKQKEYDIKEEKEINPQPKVRLSNNLSLDTVDQVSILQTIFKIYAEIIQKFQNA